MSELTEIDRYQRALDAAEQRNGATMGSRTNVVLDFEPWIEPDYLEHRRVEGQWMLRFGLLLAVFYYVTFFLVDGLFWGRYTNHWVLVPSIYIASTVSLLLFGLTWVQRVQPALSGLSAAVALINATALAVSSAFGYKLGVPIPPEAPIVQQIYILFLLNLPFRMAAPMTVIAVGIFILLHSLVGLSAADFFSRCFMITCAGTIGLFACYLTERAQRLSWLRARLLQALSERDSLTALFNHRLFYQRGGQALRQARREQCGVAVLLVDIDHFKLFNDSHGHLAGDDALRQVAAELSQCARRALDLSARLGGEEFGLLFFDTTQEMAMVRAEEIRSTVSALTLKEGRHLTISIGLAFAKSSQLTTIEALIAAADAALYRAKANGRDQVTS